MNIKILKKLKFYFKFIIFGIINTIFFYLLYSVFVFIFKDYVIAVIFANLIGILFSFKTFGKFVFNNEDKKLLYKFLIVYCWNIFLNILLIRLFNEFIDNNLYLSGIFSTAVVAVNSFFLNKYYVFQKEGAEFVST